MILAELNLPESIGLAGWLACLAFVITLVNGVLRLADRVRGKEPQPPNAELGAEFHALGQRVARLETEVEAIRAEFKEDRLSLMQAGEERAGRLHERINEVLRAVAKLEGRLLAKAE
jgi:hypothetical protein